MMVNPRRPSPERASRLSQLMASMSLLRSLEIEVLAELKLEGRTLDVGGGRNSTYREVIAGYSGFEHLNIDPRMEPSTLADANQAFPFTDASFDSVMSANTLEHLIEDMHAVRESFRVLRPGGRFVALVPFVFPVHGSPMDFHRHTANYWIHILEQLKAREITVEPLVWTPLATALALAEQRVRGVKRLLRCYVVLTGRLGRYGPGERLMGEGAILHARYALGYFIQAHKRT